MRSPVHCGFVIVLVLSCAENSRRAELAGRRLDPAAWGSDHVGEPVTDFVSGDQCLFCHREKIGITWSSNWHQKTIRPGARETEILAALASAEPGSNVAADVDFVLGGARQLRFLRRGEAYGRLDLLNTAWSPSAASAPEKLVNASRPEWDAEVFAQSCSGCHATAVDPESGAFSEISLDCFPCHGEVELEHSAGAELAVLSSTRKTPARVVVSICGQCHLRSGRSRHSGRPYPASFVAGDNLFRDLEVDWSDEHLSALEPIDRHVYQNARDVVLRGRTALTCLTCHRVHPSSTRQHYHVPVNEICGTCHESGVDDPRVGDVKWPLQSHSRVCGY